MDNVNNVNWGSFILCQVMRRNDGYISLIKNNNRRQYSNGIYDLKKRYVSFNRFSPIS